MIATTTAYFHCLRQWWAAVARSRSVEGSKNIKPIEDALALIQGRSVPDWLSLDADKKQGAVLRYPERHEMDMFIDEQLIVEYYSR